jgi:hypothetical protein
MSSRQSKRYIANTILKPSVNSLKHITSSLGKHHNRKKTSTFISSNHRITEYTTTLAAKQCVSAQTLASLPTTRQSLAHSKLTPIISTPAALWLLAPPPSFNNFPQTNTPVTWYLQPYLPLLHSSHPFDASCVEDDLAHLARITSLPPASTFTYLNQCPEDRMLVKDLRDLLSHSSPVNQQVINLYLQLLAHQFSIKALDSSFFPNLLQHG